MQYAEKWCRKLRTGTSAYSPESDILHKTAEMWALVVRFLEGKKTNMRKLTSLAKNTGTEGYLYRTLEEARDLKHESELAWRKVKPKATSL